MTPSSIQPYEHRPLTPGSNEIRLLRIERSEDKAAPIVVTLRHANLDDAAELDDEFDTRWLFQEPLHFNALSYAWGAETPTYEIIIQDDRTVRPYLVRENLYDFLSAARDFDGESNDWIWIDQICINQSDHEEQCHQVNLMADLYSKAEATIVWPGLLLDKKIDMNTAGHLYLTEPAVCPQDFDKLLFAREGNFGDNIFITESTARLLQPFSAGDCIQLLLKPYWKRLWIIQEIVLARQVHVFIFGRLWEFRKLFFAFHEWINVKHNKIRDFVSSEEYQEVNSWMDHNDKLSIQRRSIERGVILDTWGPALGLAIGRHCARRLDRVYGVMGLLAPVLRVPADYTITERKLLKVIMQRQIGCSDGQRREIWSVLWLILDVWMELEMDFVKPVGWTDPKWDMTLPTDLAWAELARTKCDNVRLTLENFGISTSERSITATSKDDEAGACSGV